MTRLSNLKNVRTGAEGGKVHSNRKRRNEIAQFRYSVSAGEWLPGKPDNANLVGAFGAPEGQINVQPCHRTTEVQWRLTLSLVGDQRTVPKDREHQFAAAEANGCPGASGGRISVLSRNWTLIAGGGPGAPERS